MNLNWSASEANWVPEKKTGPDPVQKWTATTIAGLVPAGMLSGT